MIYLLDTNIFLILLRNGLLKEFVHKKYAPLDSRNESYISVVTIGELKSLAVRNKWGKARERRLDDLLGQVLVIDINFEEVIGRYAEIDVFSQGKLDGKPLGMSARNMGKNDVWIAATVSVIGATLLTTDNDFDHLRGQFLTLEKISLSEII